MTYLVAHKSVHVPTKYFSNTYVHSTLYMYVCVCVFVCVCSSIYNRENNDRVVAIAHFNNKNHSYVISLEFYAALSLCLRFTRCFFASLLLCLFVSLLSRLFASHSDTFFDSDCAPRFVVYSNLPPPQCQAPFYNTSAPAPRGKLFRISIEFSLNSHLEERFYKK